MIYDCFYFYDELDLLEIRLNILDKHVDHFVIVEANVSFNGLNREYVYAKNLARFEKWKDKIIYLQVGGNFGDGGIFQKAIDSPNTGNKEAYWMREFYIKEYLSFALGHCRNDDIIFISDIDEIWNPDTCIFQVENGKVYRPIQKCYAFYLNNRSSQSEKAWTGTRFSTHETMTKYGPNHFRTEREVQGIPIKNGGWHFSWLSKKSDKWGDGHPDNVVRFNAARNNNFSLDEGDLPKYLLDNKDKWNYLFLK